MLFKVFEEFGELIYFLLFCVCLDVLLNMICSCIFLVCFGFLLDDVLWTIL